MREQRNYGTAVAATCECGDHAFAKATKGATALVSVEDAHLLASRHWCWMKNGYIGGRINNKTILLHRVVMNPEARKPVDHINMNRWDCRRSNLRHCDKTQNHANRKKQSNNKSGFKGVFWSTQKQKWQATICKEGKRRHIGFYGDVVNAAQAYNAEAAKLFGGFARLNEIPAA